MGYGKKIKIGDLNGYNWAWKDSQEKMADYGKH